MAGGPVLGAALVAASYALFAGVVALALGRGLPVRSCGCFGARESPPTAVHLVLNLGAAATAALSAVAGAPPLARVLGSQALAGLPFLALGAVAGYLAWAAVTVLPLVSRSGR